MWESRADWDRLQQQVGTKMQIETSGIEVPAPLSHESECFLGEWEGEEGQWQLQALDRGEGQRRTLVICGNVQSESESGSDSNGSASGIGIGIGIGRESAASSRFLCPCPCSGQTLGI